MTAPQPGGLQRPPPASRTALVVGWPRPRHRQTPCLGRTRFLVHCPPWGGGKGALGVSEMRARAPPSHPTTSRRPPPTPPHRKAVFLLRVRVFQADQPLRPLQEGTGPAREGAPSGRRPNPSADLPCPSLQVWRLGLSPTAPRLWQPVTRGCRGRASPGPGEKGRPVHRHREHELRSTWWRALCGDDAPPPAASPASGCPARRPALFTGWFCPVL